jgi:ABC-type uncharacterized transport system involved in gliding motility auxiliary subunit
MRNSRHDLWDVWDYLILFFIIAFLISLIVMAVKTDMAREKFSKEYTEKIFKKNSWSGMDGCINIYGYKMTEENGHLYAYTIRGPVHISEICCGGK